MNKLIIGYSPFESDDNSYTKNFKRILLNFGQVLDIPSVKDVINLSFKSHYDLIILNWSDNGFVNGENGNIRILGVIKAFIKLFILKFLTKKIIFVRHNVYPHNTSFKSKKLVVKLINIYEKFFDVCWVHSGHLTEDFRLYVPHPLYQISINKAHFSAETKLPKRYFIVFGRITSYKKIDKLIEVMPDDVDLVVCGSCSDDNYLKKIMSYKKNNVNIIPKYISDELAKDMVAQSLGVVICHSDEDMIVSGSIIFAVSVGVPIIAIETPFVTWFRKNVNANMIKSASDFSELGKIMHSFKSEINKSDIHSSQDHFSDRSVQSKVKSSLNNLGLI